MSRATSLFTQKIIRAILAVSMIFSYTPALASEPSASDHPLAPASLREGGPLSTAQLLVQKTASLVVDKNNNHQADPGDTLRYTTLISNTGGSAAEGIIFTDPLDANLVLVSGALEITPLAEAQSAATPEDTPLAIKLGGSDAGGDPLDYRLVSSPTLGLLGGALPDLIYTPTLNLYGVDQFVFQVCDDASPPACDTAPVSITVSSVNDAPLITDTTFTLVENSLQGAVVGQVSFFDPDPGQSHVYSITGGNTGGAFAINAASGQITVTNASLIDFETTPVFSLTVQVTDDGVPALTGSSVMRIELTDVSESPALTPASFTIDENSPQSSVLGAITYTDSDKGQLHTFTIRSGNTDDAFAIGSASGVITVAHSAALDFETTPVFTLSVRVTDDGSPALFDETDVRVSLNDLNESPMVEAASFSIPENSSSGASVGTVTYTDPDAGQTQTCSITGGNTGGAFAIHPASGLITITNSALIDFETTPVYTLTVQVADDGVPALSDSAQFRIDVADANEAPSLTPASFTIDEDSPNAAIIGVLSYTDPDQGQSHTYSIIGGNTDGAFAIGATSGQITVANENALDYENTPVFTLTVRLADNGTPLLSDITDVRIALTDLNETPQVQATSFSISENSSNGLGLGTVAYTDPDAGQSHTYSITGGNSGDAFTIGASSGQISVSDSTALDFETTPLFTLTVQVTDNGLPALSGSALVTISLTDVNEQPVITDTTFTLPENSAQGALVGALPLSDPDAGQTHTFSILDGNDGGVFAIKASSGQITVTDALALNYEATPSFTLTVQVADDGVPSLADTALVTIHLTDINETPDLSPASLALDENSPNGTVVGSLTFTDPDLGQTYSFSITGGNTGDAFAVDSSGKLTVASASAIDFETTPVFTLTVRVTDNGVPMEFDTAQVVVRLNNIPEPPLVVGETYEAFGNTILEVGAVASQPAPRIYVNSNLLENDIDPEGNGVLTATLQSASPGAVVNIAANGEFTYMSPPGASGSDHFTYLVTNKTGASAAGVVTVTLQSTIWYVQNNVATSGSGRAADPFKTLLEAQTASAAGDTIYIYAGDGATTGQDKGITLKNNQRLIGQGVALSFAVGLNGDASPTTLLEAGSQPLIDNVNSGGNGVSATDLSGIEIAGLSLAGNANAIDYTTVAGGSLVIQNTTVRSAGAEGIDINANGGAVDVTCQNNTLTAAGNAFDVRTTSGELRLVFNNNTQIKSSGAGGVFIDGSGGGQINITAFSGNSVHQDTAGTGFSINTVTFDATPGGVYNTVAWGNTTVGAVGDGVGGAGIVMSAVSGDISVEDLTIVASSGSGLQLTGTGVYNTSSGMRLVATPDVASIAATGGPAVSITSATIDLRLASLSTTNSPTTGISLVSAFGAFSTASANLVNASGHDINLDGGTLTFTYPGALNNTAGRSVSATNLSSGAVTFNGAINDTGQGIWLNGNSNTAFVFAGGLTLSTGANPALSVISSGSSGSSIKVTGSANTIQTTTGVGLQISNVTIDANGVAFRSISSNGAANGILLQNTGSGPFTISGTGSASSGGTIQNTTGDGILLSSVQNVSLSYLQVSNTGAYGIEGSSIVNFSLTNSSITGAGDAAGEDGLYINGLTGAVTLSNLAISGSSGRNVHLRNNSGIISSLSVSNNTFSNTDMTTGQDGFLLSLIPGGTGFVTLMNVTNNTFSNNRSSGMSLNVEGTAVIQRVNITGNTFNGNSVGLNLAVNGSGQMVFNVDGNPQFTGKATQINLAVNGSGLPRLEGKVVNNPSITADPNMGGLGIWGVVDGNGTLIADIRNNQVQNFSDSGIAVESRGGSGIAQATILNNQVATTYASALAGIFLRSGNGTSGETNTLCVNLSGNTANGGAGAVADYYLDRFTSASTIFNIQGLSPSPADATQTGTYILSNNTASNASVYVESGNYTNAVCATPSLAMITGSRVAHAGKSAGLSAPLNLVAQLPVSSFSIAPDELPVSVFAAGTVSETLQVDLGDLPAGKKLVVMFDALVADPLSQGVAYVDNQAQLTGDNFSAVLSDDPSTPLVGDPTRTLLYRPLSKPQAVNDRYLATEDTPLSVVAPGVLDNDIDPAGDELIAKLVTAPANGALSLSASGAFVFTPTLNFNGPTTFVYRANDWVVDSEPALVTITVGAVNDAPVLNALWPASFPSIHAGEVNNTGALVSNLLSAANGSIVADMDPDALAGMAVTSADATYGAWQYNTGSGWKDLGSPSQLAARLLAADAVTALRFRPKPGWDGLVSPAITFRAWDQTSGTNGGVASVAASGGATAFSLAANTASIRVLKSADLAASIAAEPVSVMAGALLTYTLVVTNSGPSTASNVHITDTLPAGAKLVMASEGCDRNASFIVCPIGGLEVGHHAQRLITVTSPITGEIVSLNQVQVLGAEFDPVPSNNHASASTSTFSRIVAFKFDNGVSPGDEWSRPVTTTAPLGEKFLGEFGNENVSLRLDNLPPHTQASVSFDLYLLRSWDGNQIYSTDDLLRPSDVRSVVGPDIWQIEADGETLLETTFANWSTFRQSFPGTYPDGDYSRGAGASKINALGYTFSAQKMDSGYRLAFSFDHASSSIKIDFSASGLQDLTDESWGLGNVQVALSSGAAPLAFPIYIPLAIH